MLADEPTGNLDPATSDDIMKILVEISKSGRAVMMATHNYNLIKHFPSRTMKCEDGRLLHQDLVGLAQELDPRLLIQRLPGLLD